jgi:glycosyltransferase involved in cell wall biosynthesis
MRRVFYLPLEAYRERYTESLTGWTVSRFSAEASIALSVIEGKVLPGSGTIKTGSVLDAHGRAYWSATQIAELVRVLHQSDTTSEDVIYLDDMFTPGYEAIPYILDQMPVHRAPRVFARNHAQSVDPDDFTFKMRPWMRPYETMVYGSASAIICASSVHREAMEIAMLDRCSASIKVLGLPYDHFAVLGTCAGPVQPLAERAMQVIYSSRFDPEKQPHFFMDVVEASASAHHTREIQFVLCTGGEEVRSADRRALQRLSELEAAGRIVVRRKCSKAEYYAHLAASRVQLNTARQDFISYTAIEASTFGTPTLAPAFRSFPETLRNSARHLFVPWSVQDAVSKLRELVRNPQQADADGWLARTQHGTLSRIIKEVCRAPASLPWWLAEDQP